MHRPQFCNPEAFHLFAHQLSVLNTTQGLVDAAIAVSMHAMDDVVPSRIHGELRKLAARVRRRVRNPHPQALLAHLHDVLFEEAGFRGDTESYGSPLNSYLSVVLETRRGIPVTLALVYKAVAEQLDLPVEGIALPGHFLVRVHAGGDRMIVDPFHGGRLVGSNEFLLGWDGTKTGCQPEAATVLATASHRDWLARIVRNLHYTFSSKAWRDDSRAMAELQMLLQTHPPGPR